MSFTRRAGSAGESISDSSNDSLSSHTSSRTDSVSESSSDWDVTSSDNDSSDNTTLAHSCLPSPSERSIEFDNHFSFDQLNHNHHNNTYIEGELSHFRSKSSETNEREKLPYLLKMTTSHYNEPEVETEAIFDLQIDLGYYLYSLFYPYTNLQALLFSQPPPYEKIKKKKHFKLYQEQHSIDEIHDENTEMSMDWNNTTHIVRIAGLLERLLKSAGPKGIEEIAIYQMFSSPSPLRIIYELRFGLYNNLCIIHLDRFGRRTFYYFNHEDERNFFNSDLTHSNLFNAVDVDGLFDFIRDEKRKSILDISISQTNTIKDDKNVATMVHNDNPKPAPIKTNISINKRKKKRKKGSRNGARPRSSTTTTTITTFTQSNYGHTSPRSTTKKTRSTVSSPISPQTSVDTFKFKKRYVKKTTITTTIRRISKKQRYNKHRDKAPASEKEKATDAEQKPFENYAIRSLFKRRLSKQNEKLINGLANGTINRNSNIRFRTSFHKKDRKRRRRITIEDMGNGKWCTIQLNHQFLVSGFIRNIANLLPMFLTVPLSIVKLVGMFYYISTHLLLISGSMECRNTKHNQLHILGISNKKRYKIKLNRFRTFSPVTAPKKADKTAANYDKPAVISKKRRKKKKKRDKLSVSRNKLEDLRQRKTSTPTIPPRHQSAKLNPKKYKAAVKKRQKKNVRTMSLKFRKDAYNNNHVNARHAMDAKQGNKKVSTKTKRSNKDVSLTQAFDRYGLGNCFATSLALPSWPWLCAKFEQNEVPIHTKGKYSVIFRSGGTYTWNENVSKENDLIIFNSKHLYHTHTNRAKTRTIVELNAATSPSPKKHKKHKKGKKHKHKHMHHHHSHVVKYAKPKIINGYYSKIPSFKKEIEYLSVMYNEYNCSLFSFGGLNLGRCIKSILELKLDCKLYRNLRWRKSASLKKPRYSCSLVNTAYYDNKIVIIGGLNNNSKEMRTVELYDITQRESVLISGMNEGRANCGSCYISDLNCGTIVVGGGVKYGDGSKQIELYNFDKNIWTIHKAKTNYKHSFPTMWSDQINPNIVYIGGDNIGISGGGRNANLGFIEWCDLRDCNKKQFNVLYEDSIDRLWRFRLLSRHQHNAWESRALFCM